jgi:hypothetical protein
MSCIHTRCLSYRAGAAVHNTFGAEIIQPPGVVVYRCTRYLEQNSRNLQHDFLTVYDTDLSIAG